MKLKIFRFFVIAVAIIGSACGLSSCKDTDQDLYDQLKDENATLGQKLDSEVALLESQLSNLQDAYDALVIQMAACKAECEAAWTAAINQLRQDIENKKYVTEEDLNAALNDALANYLTLTQFNDFKAEYDILAGNVANLEILINNINKALDGLDTNKPIAEHITEIESAISSMDTTVTNLSTDLGTVQTQTTQIQQDLAQTQQDLADVNSQISNAVADVTGLTTDLTNLTAQVNQNSADIAAININITNIQNEISNLTTLVTNAQTTADNALQLAQANQARLDANDALITTLQSDLANAISTLNAKDQELANAIADNAAAISENGTKIAENAAAIAQLRQDLEALKDEAAANLAAAKQELINMINNLEGRVSVLETSVSDIRSEVDTLNTKLTDLEARVAANEAAILDINDKIDDLTGRVDKLEALVDRVSSVVLQRVTNPIFGSVSMPFDMQSNILFNYWGLTSTPVKFPDFAPMIGNNFGGDAELADHSFFTGEYLTIPTNTNFFNEGDGNMGKVYFTVNPSNINMDGKEFALVNSLDEEIPVALKNVRPSTKLLSFGASRAATSSNGFYEADATLTSATAVNAIRFDVENGMKNALKNAVRDRNLAAISDVARLVFKQLESGLPAYGMKVSWDENGTQQKVYSNYSIAATSFRPLSYSFLDGADYSGRLPNFPSLQTLVDRLHLDYEVPTIDFGSASVTITAPDISDFHIEVDTSFGLNLNNLEVEVEVNIPKQEIYVYDGGVQIGTAEVPAQTVHGSTSVNLNTLKADLESELANKFNHLFNELDASLRGQIQSVVDKLVAEINNTVNSEIQRLFDDLEVKINDNLQDVVDRLQNTVNDKVESVANRIEGYYNKLGNAYDRVKRFLSNPNHYLQVTMFFVANNEFNRLSTSKVLPTILTGTGTAITLVPTTYTGDILSPAYKKYVAVSNVYGPAGKDCSNDATCRSLRNAANNSAYLNQIVTGERMTMAFDFSAARSASETYTYELYYQALDYHGYTSTQKFYVTIK